MNSHQHPCQTSATGTDFHVPSPLGSRQGPHTRPLAPMRNSCSFVPHSFWFRLRRAEFIRGGVALLCAAAFALGIGSARADDGQSAFEQANRLYEQARFPEAAAAYQKIIQNGRVSPELYFNLGNALFKSGRIGLAILNFRLAEQLAPRDPDIRANLRFARNQIDGVPAASVNWRRWIGHLTLNEWTALAITAAWLWFVLLTLRQWRPALRTLLRRWTATAGALALLLLACLTMACYDRFGVCSAIVVGRDTVVRYGPIEESNRFYTVRDGAELTVLDAKGDWLQVRDRVRRVGWLRREQVVVFPGHLKTGNG